MSEKYSYSDVIIDPEDPRVEIGKEYYFGNNPTCLLKDISQLSAQEGKLMLKDSAIEAQSSPFMSSGNKWFVCLIRKKEYTENDIITDVSDPRLKDAIGKTVYVVNLGYDPSHPFEVHTELGLHWDRIILSKNQPPRKTYAPFDLTEEEDRAWLANSWIRLKEDSGIHEYLISGFIVSDDVQYVLINLGAMSPGKLLEDFIFTSDHAPCGKLVEEEE